MKLIKYHYNSTAVEMIDTAVFSRTNGIHGNGDDRALAGFSVSSRVDGSDTVFVLQALDQARGTVPGHGDGVLVDPHPPVRTGLLTFNDVASNGGATIVFRWLPGQGHALMGDINHLWPTWRSRDGYTGKKDELE